MDVVMFARAVSHLRNEIVENGSAELLNKFDGLTSFKEQEKRINSDPGYRPVWMFHGAVRTLILQNGGTAKMLDILDNQVYPTLEVKPATFLEQVVALGCYVGFLYGIWYVVNSILHPLTA